MSSGCLLFASCSTCITQRHSVDSSDFRHSANIHCDRQTAVPMRVCPYVSFCVFYLLLLCNFKHDRSYHTIQSSETVSSNAPGHHIWPNSFCPVSLFSRCSVHFRQQENREGANLQPLLETLDSAKYKRTSRPEAQSLRRQTIQVTNYIIFRSSQHEALYYSFCRQRSLRHCCSWTSGVRDLPGGLRGCPHHLFVVPGSMRTTACGTGPLNLASIIWQRSYVVI